MKRVTGRCLFSAILLLTLGAACQPAPGPIPTLAPAPTKGTVKTALAALPQASATPTAQPSPTADPTALAVEAVRGYFEALQAGDAEKAAAAYSSFSLMEVDMTVVDAADELKNRITHVTKWSDLQVLGAEVFDDKTTLVHVAYRLAAPDPQTGQAAETQVDERWPARFENGAWRVNRERLIDFKTLMVKEQTTAGLTVKPRQLTRYSDRIVLTMLVQNATNETIVFGQTNEVMAAFVFGDQKIEAEKARLKFDRLRSNPNVTIAVKGLFAAFPDGVELRRWKNVNVEPWFVFNFNE